MSSESGTGGATDVGNTTDVPRPSIEGPVAGAPTVSGTAFDLAEFGYQQAEFFISGSTRSFVDASPLQSDGKWSVRVDTSADYKTRIVVFRPIDAADFNGTVVVEWLNVSGGSDAAVDWVQAHNELLRSGYAWVGVSAQKAGIDGGGFNISGMQGNELKAVDAARYGTLLHPGDSYSYDIFSQAAKAALSPGDVDPLGGLTLERAVAAGESPSAFRLMTYVSWSAQRWLHSTSGCAMTLRRPAQSA